MFYFIALYFLALWNSGWTCLKSDWTLTKLDPICIHSSVLTPELTSYFWNLSSSFVYNRRKVHAIISDWLCSSEIVLKHRIHSAVLVKCSCLQLAAFEALIFLVHFWSGIHYYKAKTHKCCSCLPCWDSGQAPDYGTLKHFLIQPCFEKCCHVQNVLFREFLWLLWAVRDSYLLCFLEWAEMHSRQWILWNRPH